MSERCSHCQKDDQPIDVRGQRFLNSGERVYYYVCHTCCVEFRHYMFNDEPEKTRAFWDRVWMNLNIEEEIADLVAEA